MEAELKQRIRSDEAAYSGSARVEDSLWDHLVRVARIAERIGRAEGLDPAVCRLAGLFHDAGKFSGGRYHQDRKSEEDQSVVVLKELAASHQVPEKIIEEVGAAIKPLYWDGAAPSPLAEVLFDADNLDKLGLLGVAVFFVKAGLRGRGMSINLLCQLTAELTYAHHAHDCFRTATGRAWAKKRAAETKAFYHGLLDELKEDGLYDFRIEEVEFEGFCLHVAAPATCACGGSFDRRIWAEQGLKCREVHLEHSCTRCKEQFKIRFCRPRLAAGPE